MNDPFGTDHLGTLEGSVGPSTGFFENMQQVFEQQFRVDSAFSYEAELSERYKESLDQYEALTGEIADIDLSYESANMYQRRLRGEGPSLFQLSPGDEGLFTDQVFRETTDKFLAIDQRLEGLGIKNFQQVVDELNKLQQEIDQETGTVSETATLGGTLGGFVGGVGGSFSLRDPLTLFTLGFGGFGRSIAARIGTEMGIVGAVEGVNQYAFVEPTREIAGLPEGNPFLNVAFAATGAGIIRGGFEGGSALLARRAEQRAAAEAEFDLDDTVLRNMFEQRLESPRARAALHELNFQKALDEANPYGNTAPGTRRFLQELDDVAKVAGGLPDTAIARVLPDVPYEIKVRDADALIVESEAPVVYGRFKESEAKLSQLDADILDAEARIDRLEVSDGIELIDPETAAVVRSLEEDLNQPGITREQSDDIARRINTIIETLGPQKVAKAAQDARITPKQNLASLRRSRRAEKKRYTQARRDFDAELQRVRVRDEALQRIEQAKVLPSAKIRTTDKPLLGSSIRYDVVQDAVKQTDEAVETIPARADDALGNEIDDEGMIDVGMDEPVPADLRIDITLEDGTIKTLSVKEIMEEAENDRALEEAMKSCGI